MSRIYVAVDLETTGFSAERDTILEIGAVKFRVPTTPDEEPILERWTTLVNPGRSVPYRISRLTGISDEEVARAPRLHEVLDTVRTFVGNYPVIGHNVAFELAFLQRQGVLLGQASVDTFELASILLPDAPRYSLGKLASYLELDFEGWHRALADAEMAARLFLKLWQEARALPPQTLEKIAGVAMDSRWPLRSFFVAAQRTQGRSEPAAPRSARSVPPLPQAQAPLRPLRDPAPLPLDEVTGLLQEGGRVASAIVGYEPRHEQQAMAEAVARAFIQSKHLIVEAGTGSGKSLAYLLAAIFQATTRGEPVVISTNTLNLQDQLFYEELPRLAASLQRPFTAMRLKGRSNYVCPRRVEMLRRRGGFSAAEARLLARLLVWLERTESGDRTELYLQQDEEPLWELVSAESESCRAERCAPYGTCFWLDAHARALGAHLLIVNHALLLNDLAAGGAFIPPYQDVIIDEAHHLEEQATQQFGFVLRQEQVYAALERLGQEQRGRAVGLLDRIRRTARDSARRDLATLIERCGLLFPQIASVRASADALFAALDEMLHSLPRKETRYRIFHREWRDLSNWRHLLHAVENFGADIDVMMAGLEKICDEIRALSFDEGSWQEHSDECQRASLTLGTLADEVRRILIRPESNDICWITVREWGNEDDDEEDDAPSKVTLHRAPINVAALLHERLFAQKRSVILTSATLGAEGSFTYLRERLGLEEAEELSLGSPYDFASQALVYVADDLPEPNQPHYATNLHRALVELARATEGRMLVLFTSKSQLNSAYRAISDPLSHHDIIVLAQYMDGSRTHLLERFRTAERAVLLGTHSFWEGVDIPGPALSCLVITRLPFPVPTDPIQAARAQNYHNAFLDYSLPQTVLRFRQGFGRLLRSTTDRGIVALLDARLDSKSYGDTFLNSLPPVELHVGPFRDLPPLAARWLKG